MRRLKVLMSAYACEPGKGSEPGAGWHVATEVAKHHDVWVITRANNRKPIEAELARAPIPGLHFAYYDLPKGLRFWKKGGRGVEAYYYLWQLGIYRLADQLHQTIGFDVTQHVTFARYWIPSLLSRLPAPFVWGPIGGAESAPFSIWPGIGPKGYALETMRVGARQFGEMNPLVRATARNTAVALAATRDTQARLERLGCRNITILGVAGLPSSDIETLNALPLPKESEFRFISMGRLIHWKGVHFALRAFAKAGMLNATFWILGDGPERPRLEALTKSLGLSDSVRFWGNVPRDEALKKLAQCHTLVHPSLHDSGGWVCLEAMAAGRPVICLDLGGPGLQVTEETGIKVPACNPEQAVKDLAGAMKTLADDRSLWQRLGVAGREHVAEHYSWQQKGLRLSEIYKKVVNERS